MGQLEKYGLYVLCLVIFLILGVTIWGGGDAPAPGQRTPAVAMHAPGGGTPSGGAATGDDRTGRRAERADRATAGAGGDLLDSLLQPMPQPKPPAKAKDPGPAVPAVAGDSVAQPKDANAAAGGGAAAAPAPSTRTYTVRRGDTFDGIAKRELGDANRRAEIAALNPGVDPKRIQPGQQIVLPTSAATAVPAATTAAPAKGDDTLRRAGAYRVYTVRDGDTLGAIARRELGSLRRLDDLRSLNPDVDPRLLRVGQKIKLPLE